MCQSTKGSSPERVAEEFLGDIVAAVGVLESQVETVLAGQLPQAVIASHRAQTGARAAHRAARAVDVHLRVRTNAGPFLQLSGTCSAILVPYILKLIIIVL